jgi:aminoglycoside phosphotransferase (APT) family kinase protein
MMNSWLLQKLDGVLPDLEELTFLKVPSRPGNRGNVVFLVFTAHQQGPRFVVKLARDGRASNSLDREVCILRALAQVTLNSRGLCDTIPRVVYYDVDEGVLVETSLAGRKLRGEFGSIAELDSPGFQLLLDDVSSWLDEFHQVGLAIGDTLQDSPDVRYETSLLQAIYGREFEELERLEYLASLLEKTLDVARVPSLVCHGDFNPYNILVSNHRVGGVYDWEDWVLADPLLDRFHFVTVTIGHLPYRDIHQFPDRVAQFLLSGGLCAPVGDLVERFLARPVSGWGYDVDYINHYYAVYLYRMMKKEIRRADSDSMLAWRKLLILYLRRLERNQPGLLSG